MYTVKIKRKGHFRQQTYFVNDHRIATGVQGLGRPALALSCVDGQYIFIDADEIREAIICADFHQHRDLKKSEEKNGSSNATNSSDTEDLRGRAGNEGTPSTERLHENAPTTATNGAKPDSRIGATAG